MTEVRAAVLTAARTVEIAGFPFPELSDDDGLLQVEAAGVCGADYPVFATGRSSGALTIEPPVILGHEIVGRVTELGRTAAERWNLRAGSRIVVERWIPCGHCRRCYAGDYRLCDVRTKQNTLFYGGTATTIAPALWGGFAEHLYLHPDTVVYPVSDEAPAHLVPLFTPLANALCWVQEIGGLRTGGSIVIQGPGQEGLAAVVAAREAGAEHIVVLGLGPDARRLELAARLGATRTVDVDRDDPVAAVREATGGELADVVLDVSSGSNSGQLETAVRVVREQGTVVLASAHRQGAIASVVAEQIVDKVLTVRGMRGRHRWAIPVALRLIDSGRYPLELLCSDAVGLDGVADALARMGGESGGRDTPHVVVQP